MGKAMQQDVLAGATGDFPAAATHGGLAATAADLSGPAQHPDGTARECASAPCGRARPKRAACAGSASALAEANDPMLAREAQMGEREDAALALSRKDATPDLSVGYMFQQRTGLPDMYGMQFTVNLPASIATG